MNPYDNNPFETERFKDSRSEFDANIELAKEAAYKDERATDGLADFYRSNNPSRSATESRKSFYAMGVRHGLVRAHNMFDKSMK